MIISKNFDPKYTTFLIGYESYFSLFKKMLQNNSLPEVIMFSGEKGIGKATFVNHCLYFQFDNKNYNEKTFTIDKESSFYSKFVGDLLPNIYCLDGTSSEDNKIEKIRELKINLSKSSFKQEKRYIILDNVETFNINCLNALLKLLETPSKNNHFVLINNKTFPLIETVKSRCFEIKVYLNNKNQKDITSKLLEKTGLKVIFDKNIIPVTPGNFLRFNYLFQEKKLDLNEKYLYNITKILNLYKKSKDIIYKDLIFYLTQYHLKKNQLKNKYSYKSYIERMLFISKHTNDFFLFNLNQATLINSIEKKLNG